MTHCDVVNWFLSAHHAYEWLQLSATPCIDHRNTLQQNELSAWLYQGHRIEIYDHNPSGFMAYYAMIKVTNLSQSCYTLYNATANDSTSLPRLHMTSCVFKLTTPKTRCKLKSSKDSRQHFVAINVKSKLLNCLPNNKALVSLNGKRQQQCT